MGTTVSPLSPNDSGQIDTKSIELTVNNVVCSFSTRCHLNLRRIAMEGFNVEFRRDLGVVNMKLRKPNTTATMWSSGKITCVGAKSEQDAYKSARRFCRLLQHLKFKVKLFNYRVVNVLCTCALGFSIDLKRLANDFKNECSYEPELHPGASFKLEEMKTTLKLFTTGSVTITAPSVDASKKALNQIQVILLKYKHRDSNEIKQQQQLQQQQQQQLQEQELKKQQQELQEQKLLAATNGQSSTLQQQQQQQQHHHHQHDPFHDFNNHSSTSTLLLNDSNQNVSYHGIKCINDFTSSTSSNSHHLINNNHHHHNQDPLNSAYIDSSSNNNNGLDFFSNHNHNNNHHQHHQNFYQTNNNNNNGNNSSISQHSLSHLLNMGTTTNQINIINGSTSFHSLSQQTTSSQTNQLPQILNFNHHSTNANGSNNNSQSSSPFHQISYSHSSFSLGQFNSSSSGANASSSTGGHHLISASLSQSNGLWSASAFDNFIEHTDDFL